MNHLLRTLACLGLGAMPCHGDALVPQAGTVPLVLDAADTTDNLIVLMAAASEHNAGLTQLHSGPPIHPKHFWFKNWNDRSHDFMKWTVSAAEAGDYRVYAKLSSNASVPLRLSIEGTAASLPFTTRDIGWDRVDAGVIRIPAGTSKLALVRDDDSSNEISILSLELLREQDRAAYEQRVAAFRSDTSWFSRSKYGIMLQAGPWSYPPTGTRRKSLEDYARDFDVPRFVETVKSTGARYVIWSMTWWTYDICAPLRSVDEIVGDGSRTSRRDLIGEVATALQKENIRFMLYYHCGHGDRSIAENSPSWWAKQQFPDAEFSSRGTGDRSVFFNHWIKVVTEVGERYGTKLDGWFFDDGLIYYPAPFERLGKAAKAGNPARLVSYNPWVAVRNTDFQDVWMGENHLGKPRFGSAERGGDGLFTDGPLEGLLEHGMFTMEQDWGVHRPNQPIRTKVTPKQAISWVRNASRRGVPLSFNLMMWGDHSFSQRSLDVLEALKAELDATPDDQRGSRVSPPETATE